MRQLGPWSWTVFPSFGLLVLLAMAPAAATTIRYEDQRIVWNSQAVLLPPSSHYGGSLCAAVGGPGYAMVGAPEGAARAELSFDGESWLVPFDQQFTSPAGAQPYACGPDGAAAGFVRGLKMSDGSYRIYVEPQSDLLVNGITDAPVESVVKYGTTLAVGQPEYGVGGRVRIYELNQQFGWLLAETVNGVLGERIGAALAMKNELVIYVGAPGFGDNGAVKILVKSGPESWIEYLRLDSPSCCQTGADFGAALAASGDWLAVGSPRHDRLLVGGAMIPDVGTVWLYEQTGFGWELDASVRPTEAGQDDLYGTSVALRQVGTDGMVLAAGSPGDDSGPGPDEGSAYVHELLGGQWQTRWRLLDSNPDAADELGTTVALSPAGALVGAPNRDANLAQDQGAVLFFRLPLFADGFESGDASAWSGVVP